MIRFARHALFFVALCVTTALAWNAAAWGFMVGHSYYNEPFGLVDLVGLSMILAALPAAAFAALSATIVAADTSRWIKAVAIALLLAIAAAVAHLLYWQQVRGLCCGATW